MNKSDVNPVRWFASISKQKYVDGQKLTAFHLILFSGPAVSMAVLWVPLLAYLPTFYATETGISLTWIGVAFMLARIWDGISDPLIGMLSDTTRCRFGRRRSWIVGGLVPYLISAYFLCQPEPGVSNGYLLFWLMAFYSAWTALQVPYLSWGAEIAPEYHARSRVFIFRETGTVLGFIVATGLPLLLLPLDAPLYDVLRVLTLTALIMLPVTVLATLLYIGERSMPRESGTSDWVALYTALRINPPYLRFTTFVLLMYTSFNFVNATFVLLITRHLQLPNAFMALIFIQYLFSILVIPATLYFIRQHGRHRVLAGGLFGLGITTFILPLLPPGEFLPVAVVTALMGLFSSTVFTLPPAIIGDLADFGELKGQTECTGTYMAGYNIAMKIGTTLGVGIAFPLLQALGFDPQDEVGIANTFPLVIAGGIIPAVLLIVIIPMIWNFPIDAKRHGIIRRWLDRRIGRIACLREEEVAGERPGHSSRGANLMQPSLRSQGEELDTCQSDTHP